MVSYVHRVCKYYKAYIDRKRLAIQYLCQYRQPHNKRLTSRLYMDTRDLFSRDFRTTVPNHTNSIL